MDQPYLAAGIGVAIGLSGAALYISLQQRNEGGDTSQQSALSSYEVRRDDEGRILGIEAINAPSSAGSGQTNTQLTPRGSETKGDAEFELRQLA